MSCRSRPEVISAPRHFTSRASLFILVQDSGRRSGAVGMLARKLFHARSWDSSSGSSRDEEWPALRPVPPVMKNGRPHALLTERVAWPAVVVAGAPDCLAEQPLSSQGLFHSVSK
jgi:hypothetical protein